MNERRTVRITWLEIAVCVVAIVGGAVVLSQLVGCVGEAFTVEPPWGDAGGQALTPVDDAATVDGAPVDTPGADAAEDHHLVMTRPERDAGEQLDAEALLDSAAPAADGSDTQPDGGHESPPDAGTPPPPPALCCLTPCQGSSVAAITCGNGPAWSCSAGSCSDRACAVGAACTWMGSCAGRVAPCQ